MANWIICDSGDAVNLDMATQLIYNNGAVRAYFACEATDSEFGIDSLIIKRFDRQSEAIKYIHDITNNTYVSEAYRLAEALA